jgi:hypothetical protein
MESPRSDQESHCPECGALLAANANHCWKCRREFLQKPRAAGSRTESAGGTTGVGGSSPVSGGTPPIWRETRGQPLSSADTGIRFLKILGVLAVMVVAAGIAFFATCFGGFFASDAMAPHVGGGLSGLDRAIATGIICGGVVALAVTVGLIWLFWLRPRRPKGPMGPGGF